MINSDRLAKKIADDLKRYRDRYQWDTSGTTKVFRDSSGKSKPLEFIQPPISVSVNRPVNL